MRFHQFIAITGLALTCALIPAHAEKRVALVIGNDRYANLAATEQLQKAVNDAKSVGGALKSIGFDVIPGDNFDRRALVAKPGNDVTSDLLRDTGDDTPPVAMENPATIRAGARAFASRGCTICHGGPGVIWAKFSEGLRPDPPDLKESARDLTTSQIFKIVKYGINKSGMPAFALADVPDREIWTIAAFTKKKLPGASESDYKAWTADALAPAAVTAPR